MPLSVEKLNKQSSMDSIDKAIGESIETCMNEKDRQSIPIKKRQQQCIAIAYSIARKQTGKSLKPHKRQ